MNNFMIRTITGLLFVGVIVGSILFSSISFIIVFYAFMLAGMLEFYQLSHMTKARPHKINAVIIGSLLYIFSVLYAVDLIRTEYFLVFLPFLMLTFITEVYQDSKRPFLNIAVTFLGIIYVALPFTLLPHFALNSQFILADYKVTDENQVDVINEIVNYLSLISKDTQITYSPNIILSTFFLIWAFDTMSYVFGITFGRTRLFEKLSPKKTWEGLIGGAISTGALVYLLSIFFKELTLIQWSVVGMIIIIVGTYGDLVESMFKRSVGAKDSGKIMPGHGGILDRFDSFILAIPIIYTYLQLVE